MDHSFFFAYKEIRSEDSNEDLKVDKIVVDRFKYVAESMRRRRQGVRYTHPYAGRGGCFLR